MSYQEILELLLAAKSLIDQIKYGTINQFNNRINHEALEEIDQVLESYPANQLLLKEAGWTNLDLLVFNRSLAYYRSKYNTVGA